MNHDEHIHKLRKQFWKEHERESYELTLESYIDMLERFYTDHFTEAGKMVDNKVMLQRAYGWLRSHYPNVEVLHLQVEVMASYMARFAQEQIKSATILTPEQEEAKLIHDVCPKCGNADVIWTCYCNECKEAH